MNEYKLMALLSVLLLLAILVVVFPVQRQSMSVRLGMVLVLVGFTLLGYWQWGAWSSLNAYHQQQAKQIQAQALLKSIKNPQQLVGQLKEHLAHHPESARGWFLLGRLYSSQGAWFAAFEVFKRAHQLEPNNEEITVNYAQSMWQNNHQKFNDAVRELFRSLLQHNPKQPDALSMLAIDAFQQHAYPQAISYWTQLLALLPPDSEDAKAIRKAIAKGHEMDNSHTKD